MANESDDLLHITARAKPGMMKYDEIMYAEVVAEHDYSGVHQRIEPVCCVDIQILTADGRVDRSIKPIPKVAFLAMSGKYVTAPPEKGDICVLCFPYHQANTALLMGVLYDKKNINVRSGEWHLEGAKKAGIKADAIALGSANDNAVLHSKLVEKLGLIENLIEKLGSTCVYTGSPHPQLAAIQAAWGNIGLQDMKSEILIGDKTK